MDKYIHTKIHMVPFIRVLLSQIAISLSLSLFLNDESQAIFWRPFAFGSKNLNHSHSPHTKFCTRVPCNCASSLCEASQNEVNV